MPAKLQPHLKIKKGDVADIILLPGDPARIDRITKYWDITKEIAYNREFRTVTGSYKGIPISAVSTGVGSPSAAITVEELGNVGAQTLIRIGTCGALRKEIQAGNIIIPNQALRQEGTTREYIGQGYKAVPSQSVYQALVAAAQELSLTFFTGMNRTHDAFYETTENFLRLMDLAEYRQGELISSEMECSSVFVIASLRGLQAGAVLGVNTCEPLEDIAKNPDLIYQLEESPHADKGVEDAIKTALRAVELISKQKI